MPEQNIATAARKRRPIPGASESEERLLAMVTALTGELAITRERLDTLERLVEGAGILARSDIETFEANPEQADQRRGIQHRIIAKVFRPLRDSAERDVEKARKNAHKETQEND